MLKKCDFIKNKHTSKRIFKIKEKSVKDYVRIVMIQVIRLCKRKYRNSVKVLKLLLDSVKIGKIRVKMEHFQFERACVILSSRRCELWGKIDDKYPISRKANARLSGRNDE